MPPVSSMFSPLKRVGGLLGDYLQLAGSRIGEIPGEVRNAFPLPVAPGLLDTIRHERGLLEGPIQYQRPSQEQMGQLVESAVDMANPAGKLLPFLGMIKHIPMNKNAGIVNSTGLLNNSVMDHDAIFKKLENKWGDASFTPRKNALGGQMVHLLGKDGEFVSGNVASHNDLLSRAGISGSLEDLMAETGIIRMHDIDNFEIWGRPSRAQIESIADVAADNYGAYIDLVEPNSAKPLFSGFMEFSSKQDLARIINNILNE